PAPSRDNTKDQTFAAIVYSKAIVKSELFSKACSAIHIGINDVRRLTFRRIRKSPAKQRTAAAS
ncbi:hypothetical protein ACFQLY_18915, partial [Paraburkholderia dipogonis]|uniref:hypothetical protein n=1 Tax=Paraburkholderia dipogonis TaxID=1211383 RepID=UPI00360F7355